MDTTFTALVGPEEVNIGQAALWQKGYARLQGLEEGCFLLRFSVYSDGGQ